MSQGFYMLQSSHWHGPCTSDDTLPFGWLKKEAAAAASGFFPRLGFAGYEPKCYGAWVNSALCAAMDRRRRQLRETADERLDRLIAMERNSRISSPVPEVRRLMVEEGRAAASSPGPDVMVEEKVKLLGPRVCCQWDQGLRCRMAS